MEDHLCALHIALKVEDELYDYMASLDSLDSKGKSMYSTCIVQRWDRTRKDRNDGSSQPVTSMQRLFTHTETRSCWVIRMGKSNPFK